MMAQIRKLKPYYIRKALRYLRHYGPHDFAVRVRERLAPEHVPYGPWFEKHRASDDELASQRREMEGYVRPEGRTKPLFSVIVPVFRTPERYLREMADSVLGQTFPDFELLLANADPGDRTCSEVLMQYGGRDPRVRVIPLEKNLGISGNTNEALRHASGEYVCFLDHDDVLQPDALYRAYREIDRTGRSRGEAPELLYTDEDKIRDDGKGGTEHFQPHFKPDFNLDLLRSNQYICHFLIVKRSLVEEIGDFDEAYDGAQDYDFVLRCTDRIREKRGLLSGKGIVTQPGICHIPRVLYSWRVHASSTADNPDSKRYAYDAGRRALQAHLKRCGEKGEALEKEDYGFYRIRYEKRGSPLVSVIIPNREQKQTLKRCIDSIREHTDGDRLEIIVVENGSSSAEILSYYKEIQGKDHIRVIRWKGDAFSFSEVCNYGADRAKGQYLVFMNNDVEVRDGWLSELLPVAQRPEVGAAGPKLFYPDGRIQSAGIVVGIGQTAGSLFAGMNGSFSGYLHKASVMQDLSAVTGALMMVKREVFEKAGGFSKELAVAFNDVDLCLRMRELGYLIVYDPYAEAVHHESVSRGDEYTKTNAERYRREASFLRERWSDYYRNGDPYYNPNLSLKRWDYSLNDE